jgi:NADH-quinone oxidoreductase subunit F
MSGLILTAHMQDGDSHTLERYEAAGGYETLRRVLSDGAPAAIIDEVKAAGLRGRGGAGFPTGVKWGFLAEATPRYLVVNADESEPGSFKDRQLLERDPHQLIEGIAITSYALGVHHAFVYVRGEYARPARRLQRALDEALGAGYLGADVLGSGFGLDVTVHLGAGAYICGEETALLNSLIRRWRASTRVPPSSTTWRPSAASPGSCATAERPMGP